MAIILTAILKVHGSPLVAQGDGREFRQLHLGMEVRLVLHAEPKVADDAARAAYARIAALEAILSDWRPTSEVRRLEQRAGAPTPVSAPLFEVTARALTMSRASGGAFDPTVAPLVALWREARTTGSAPDEAAVRAARQRVGWQRVTLDSTARTIRLAPGTRLDLGGIAKGWIIGEAGAVLRANGVTSWLIEAGGDLLLGAAPPGETGWRVAITKPTGDTTMVLHDTAVATSGPSAQHVIIDGVAYSHVLDPRRGVPLTSPFEVTVLHHDPATADALATAITVLGEVEGMRLAQRFGATLIRRR